MRWIFSKSLSYLYEVGRTNFPSIFGIFAIFDRYFAKIVAPPSDENRASSASEKSITYKKHFEKDQNRRIIHDTILGSSMPASKEQRTGGPERDTQKTKRTNATFSHLQAGARSTIFPKFCTAIEDIEVIKMCQSFFDPTHRFSYRMHGFWGK